MAIHETLRIRARRGVFILATTLTPTIAAAQAPAALPTVDEPTTEPEPTDSTADSSTEPPATTEPEPPPTPADALLPLAAPPAKPAPPLPVAITPAPAITPHDRPAPIPRPSKPRHPHRISNGLGIGFMLAGAGAIAGGGYLLTESVTTTDAGQSLQIPDFVLGSTLAIGGSAMLGGGAGILVATAVACEPARRRPVRHASWLFLVSAGAFASAATYTALDAHQQWKDAPGGGDTYAASNAGFNRATVLAALAVAQLAVFGGIHRATREPTRHKRYAILPPALGVTRHSATATLGLRF
jgi:hypothetical protein